MADSRKTRTQVQRVFGAFIKARQSEYPSLNDVGVHVFAGQLDEAPDGTIALPADYLLEMQLPAVIVHCPGARDHDAGGGYMVCELMVFIVTQVDESNAPQLHADRVGDVAAIFDEPEAIVEELSPPAVGADVRQVKDFRCFGFFHSDESGQIIERRLQDYHKFEVHCTATDDAD